MDKNDQIDQLENRVRELENIVSVAKNVATFFGISGVVLVGFLWSAFNTANEVKGTLATVSREYKTLQEQTKADLTQYAQQQVQVHIAEFEKTTLPAWIAAERTERASHELALANAVKHIYRTAVESAPDDDGANGHWQREILEDWVDVNQKLSWEAAGDQ